MAEDRYRTPSPSQPPPRPRSPEEAYDRLQALETRVLIYEERVNRRLIEASGEVVELKAAVIDLRPKRQAVLPWIAVLIAVGGIVFRAGNYPDRDEFKALDDRTAGEVQALRGELRALQLELVRACSGPLESLDRRMGESLVGVERRLSAVEARRTR